MRLDDLDPSNNVRDLGSGGGGFGGGRRDRALRMTGEMIPIRVTATGSRSKPRR